MFPILGWGYFELGHFLHIFMTRHSYIKHFPFILHHLVLIVINTFLDILICMFDEIIKKMIIILHSN